MPASALLTATLEQAINRVLPLDPDSVARLQALSGARLTAFVAPLPFGLSLSFSEQVDVHAVHEAPAEVVAALTEKECCIQTSLSVLPELQQTSQLTRLIQQQKLTVDGELQIAQQVSALFQQLDIDWEEQLAQVTNDVIAHQAFATGRQVHERVTSLLGTFSRTLGNAVVEEKQLAAHRLAVMHFNDSVSTLRDDVARAENRLEKLEQRFTKR